MEWLVEAKVLYSGNATDAVRAAIGQLMTYRYFLYQCHAPPYLLALFNEPVRDAYSALMESLGIAVTCRDGGDRRSTPLASDFRPTRQP
jgi:hypothetical protein